ncbi:alpha/beta hydrolase [Halobacteriales archaeon QH_7_66_37]|nr:MAG: alpha/beta hydrolase [Halobacteriales archaeon QH_7_66_37]
METVTHDGRETAYRLARPEGPGPTTLYVHGSGGNHRLWANQYGPDGPAHPAVAVDLSGHGESEDIDTDPGPATLSAYAADVAAVAEATDAVVLVGNSLGGAVVFRTLLDGLYEPDAAVFAGSGAKLGVHERIRELLREDYRAVIEFLHEDSRLFYRGEESVVERSESAMREAGQAVTRRDYRSCHTFDVRDDLDAIEVPSLAVVGEHDNLTPPAYHEYLAEELPDCELAVVDDAAHLAMVEQPESFNASVATFLDGRLE